MPNKSDVVIIRPCLISFPNLLNIMIRIDINTKFRRNSSSLLPIARISSVFAEMRKNTNPITKAERYSMEKSCWIGDPLAVHWAP